MQESFITACTDGNIEEVKKLLQDPNVDLNIENAALTSAAMYGRIEVMKLLLQDEKVSPSGHHNYPIIWASCFGYFEAVKLLSEHPSFDSSLGIDCAIKKANANEHNKIAEFLTNRYKL